MGFAAPRSSMNQRWYLAPLRLYSPSFTGVHPQRRRAHLHNERRLPSDVAERQDDGRLAGWALWTSFGMRRKAVKLGGRGKETLADVVEVGAAEGGRERTGFRLLAEEAALGRCAHRPQGGYGGRPQAAYKRAAEHWECEM